MSLLLSENALAARREVAAGPLAPLAGSLAADLEPLLSREIYFPADKALLSREGGQCPRDGSLLEFDPFAQHEHRCPRCGEWYRGELHDRFWIYWYQLWLAERAVHATVLHRLGLGEHWRRLAATILDGYSERYASYPNVDNVLGPTRLFFSTYLESIWLLQICIATDLLGETDRSLGGRVRDRVIEPSRAIIAEYDEGGSNRQVWNNAALLAAARQLGDNEAASAAAYGRSGITSHLAEGLLADGTWFEGENYHLFAHRGLWYGVTMSATSGLELPSSLVDRFQRGFATPFATALPDFTLPSRRDSQYAISLRQWRIAEHCELGLARRADPVLVDALQRLYCDDVPRRDTGRRTSSADVERNAPPSSLSRADLSWRALLCAVPDLPPLDSLPPRSVLLEGQGIAVFRRNEGRTYTALDYGHSGGGHGHPDRLNLLIADGDQRWLDDYGTGSYVDPSLHWYRSTLAHNAPLVGGKSQLRVNGRLVAYDERGAAGWITATAERIAPDVSATRTIVVMPEYVIDELAWEASGEVVIDLPLHADLVVDDGAGPLTSAELTGGDGLEDGFRFLRDTEQQLVSHGVTAHAVARASDATLAVWARGDRDTEWWRVIAPGPPGSEDRAFRVLRARGSNGRHVLVIALSQDVSHVRYDDDLHITFTDGTTHLHRRLGRGWHIELRAGSAKSSIDLGGFVEGAASLDAPSVSEPARAGTGARRVIALARHGTTIEPTIVELGESAYRRSEQSWTDAGRPTARVTLEPMADSLRITVDVPKSELTFAAPAATNLYDNELPDINGDGVQLYTGTAAGLSGWMLVPRADSGDVGIRSIDGWTAPQRLSAKWRRIDGGYRIEAILDAIPSALDIIVNEMPRGRRRRRGQLVMSGALGEFVYLRGDRHEPGRLIPLRMPDA